MKTWKIKGKYYLFPSDWNKKKVLRFCNTDIKFCPLCTKIDCEIDHFRICNPIAEMLKNENLYYKD